ncbi:C-terminal binding protein [Noviherbaspirillum sp. Root189]|uniref:C-terminal binding protein n=1 Tax=Noviherbaspirillum sp. Root189 TaxID=1736487 RepID=UPI00070B94F3|nr:C-terminal binding protein [Noviherbaspirillum sp. Root189]KRB93542.1 phosphoglycerate dehydrogenase [Noviherbaspirillum sp. Root189]
MTQFRQDTVLLTDFAWPDIELERGIIAAAGFRLVAGPSSPASAETIEALAREHQPAAIMTCWAQVSSAAIASSPGLKIVARMGVGLDNIAVASATERGVLVTNVPDYCVEEVSDHVMGMLLAWTRGIVSFDRDVRSGNWNPASAQLRRLSALTCGIIGYGRIGRRTAAKLKAFGVRLLVSDPHPQAEDGITFTDLDTLLAQSDAVIVHAPLVPSTRHLINRERIARMKQGAMLVNVSRGGIVDTDAVIAALQSGQLSGAGLDVLESEPDVPAALADQPGAIITPHVAFSSDVSLIELRRRACEEVVRVLRGENAHFPCNKPTVPA